MHRRARWALKIIAAALLIGSATAAQAEPRKYALLIGSNRGHAHETPLRFAESDVEAFAKTLTEFSGFSSERIVRVLGGSATRVRTAILDLNLAVQSDARAGHEVFLFVFVSGHADAKALHLGGTELPTEELSKLVRTSGAKLKILLLDACRSGVLTQVKGGRQVAPFKIGVESELRHEGFATITSSAAGEDSQESDALSSSIFTYHFLAALRGFGDTNADHQVTLGEAYAYAYERTLATSLTTIVGSQHATYDYDLRGRADPVLADLRMRGERGEVILQVAGEYLFLAPDSGALLLEAATRDPGMTVQLPAGRYGVRLRTKRQIFRTEIQLNAGQALTLPVNQMTAVPLAEVVRKGETELRIASGPSIAGLVHGPLGAGFSAMWGVTLGWAIEMRRFSVMPRLHLAQGQALRPPEGSAVQTHRLQEIGVDLTALFVFDLGPISVAPLLSVGWAMVQQTIECSRPDCNRSARPQALVSTVGTLASLPLGRGFSLEAGAEAAGFYLPRQDRSDPMAIAGEASTATGTLTYRASLGLGFRY